MSKKRRRQAKRIVALTKPELATIDNCVGQFKEDIHLFKNAAEGVVLACMNEPKLQKFIHFIKHRLKDPKHLRAKLRKKALEDKKDGRKPTINEANLFREITDLAGVRILHLYTDEIAEMNLRILTILKEQKYTVVKGPVANIWDHEADQYFAKLGFETVLRDTMYTSVHYEIELNTVTGVRCELQLRTLADEVWGEVSHTMDYPNPTGSVACKEQLKVLARVTSGRTRLVDSIFRSQEEFEKQRAARRKLRKKFGT
ncbi:MAG: (p)ppGpp synthetase [Planctomycetes bacterium]|nr:(p)ppGpp synthetase [Planctomycetota bacterium]